MSEPKYVRFFEEVGIDDVPLVGGKNASLGEMYRELGSDGVRVPNGFATTSEGYNHMLEEADAWKDLHAALDDLDSTNVTDLGRRGQRAREIVYRAGLPEDLAREIIAGYRRLQEEYGDDVSLAVRSPRPRRTYRRRASPASRRPTSTSMATGRCSRACRRCYSSLFTDRAIHYRVERGFDHFGLALSIGIMKMVRSDLAASARSTPSRDSVTWSSSPAPMD